MSTDLISSAARLVVLVPFVAAILGLFVARRRVASAAIACTGSVLTLLAGSYTLYALYALPTTEEHPEPIEVSTIGALPLGGLEMPLRLLVDNLSAVVVVAVAIVGLTIQLFTKWYLADDDRYGAFTASVSLFLTGMFLVVLSGDLILTLVGWEVMGWCSYLLIGHNSRKESARRAATKAFLVTRTADLAFVIGLIILATGPGTTSIPEVLAYWSGLPGATLLTVGLICVLSGIAGKSGLFPFHDWLPDAMEGPTPASALIHAATMVAAGTIVLARLFPIFVLSDPARLLLAVLTALTMIGAAVLAFGQSDIKRLLAYSTLSQIAIMLSAIAVAPAAEGPGPGILHMMSHAMFKALLFLAIGWLSVLVVGTSALAMSGGVRRHPQLAWPIGIGLAALAGVPPLVGFVSKEYVLGAALASSEAGAAAGWIVLIAMGVTIVLTAAYCTRAWLVLTRRGTAAGAVPVPAESGNNNAAHSDHGHAGIQVSARLSVWLLAFLSVVGGLIIFTPLALVELHINYYLAGASMLLILAAVVAVGAMAKRQPSRDAAVHLGAERMLLFDQGYGADGVYVAVANRVVQLARIVVLADRQVVDAYVRGTVVATRWAGVAGERVHTRKPSSYLVWLLFGLLAVGVTGVTLW